MNESVTKKITGFLAQYPVLRYERPNIVIYAGEKPHGVFFIQKGFVKVYSTSSRGKELTIAMLDRNDFFPLVWLYRNEASGYFYECYEGTEIVKSPRDDILRFIHKNPEVSLHISRDFVERYQRSLKRLEYMAKGAALVKVASTLQILAEKFGHKISSQTFIRIPLTHKDIADYSGVTRETASLEIEYLEKEGVIAQKSHHFHILNMDKLKALLDG